MEIEAAPDAPATSWASGRGNDQCLLRRALEVFPEQYAHFWSMWKHVVVVVRRSSKGFYLPVVFYDIVV